MSHPVTKIPLAQMINPGRSSLLQAPDPDAMQVLEGNMYIAGETEPWDKIQDSMKTLLANVWTRYKHHLPDIDIMIQFDDWMLPNLTGAVYLSSSDRAWPDQLLHTCSMLHMSLALSSS